jgi:hypothetical protein
VSEALLVSVYVIASAGAQVGKGKEASPLALEVEELILAGGADPAVFVHAGHQQSGDAWRGSAVR